ncbi:hypothetical protein QE152_g31938 [Popillia japonica]|uniref:Uncharacterized protein n=1 Tax=Popillia japonica TaxID=7064 RepID=A0AAW1J132_POPJA
MLRPRRTAQRESSSPRSAEKTNNRVKKRKCAGVRKVKTPGSQQCCRRGRCENYAAVPPSVSPFIRTRAHEPVHNSAAAAGAARTTRPYRRASPHSSERERTKSTCRPSQYDRPFSLRRSVEIDRVQFGNAIDVEISTRYRTYPFRFRYVVRSKLIEFSLGTRSMSKFRLVTERTPLGIAHKGHLMV